MPPHAKPKYWMTSFPYPLFPDKRVCGILKGQGIVKLYNGVPVFIKPDCWPTLRIGEHRSVRIDGKMGAKMCLENNLDLVKENTEKAWTEKALREIRECCWQFFKDGSTWNISDAFQPAQVPSKVDQAKSDILWFYDDISAGQRIIGEVYPEFLEISGEEYKG